MSDEKNVIFMDFFAVKVDGGDVIAGIFLYENLFTDSHYDITSVNFNSDLKVQISYKDWKDSIVKTSYAMD